MRRERRSSSQRRWEAAVYDHYHAVVRAIVAIDGTNLFWSNLANFGSDSVMKAELDGSNAVAIATDRPGPQELALDATNVYWTENGVVGGALSAVAMVSRNGGTVVSLQSYDRGTVGNAKGLTSDAKALYYAVSGRIGLDHEAREALRTSFCGWENLVRIRQRQLTHACHRRRSGTVERFFFDLRGKPLAAYRRRRRKKQFR